MNQVLKYVVIVSVASGVFGLLLIFLAIKLLPGIKLKITGFIIACFCLAVASAGAYLFWNWDKAKKTLIEEMNKT